MFSAYYYWNELWNDSNFERLYTNGGTLLEQKNAKKEDSAPTRKINEQASTALELRR